MAKEKTNPPVETAGNRPEPTPNPAPPAQADAFEISKSLAQANDSHSQALSAFAGLDAFENAQRMAKMIAGSSLVPKQYQNNIPNAVIALEMAQRIGASPLAVMQNLYIVHGNPGWSAQFVIASLNSCGRYSPLRFDMQGDGDLRTCTAHAIELKTGEVLAGPPVSIDMAKKEGWFQKTGSKWQTMPEVMLRYRAASFFGKLYAPDILMGMQTAEELSDIIEGEIDDGTLSADEIGAKLQG